MLPPETIAHLAGQLYEAERNGRPAAIFSFVHPNMTIADSYAIQRSWALRRIDGGARPIGHKIGLTSVTMQQAMGIDEPDCGVLLDDMVIPAGGRIAAGRFRAPMIEVELAFILDAPVSRGAGIDAILHATREIRPALEIIDARMHRIDPATRRPRTVLDTIADNAASAGLMLGDGVVPKEGDLPWVGATLARNGKIEATGLAAGVLGHPATGVAWLADRLALHGEAMNAGAVILSGSFTRPLAVDPGDSFVADFGPYGTVSCTFD